MKDCTYCGRENDDAATTCRDCGKPFEPQVVEDRRALEDPNLALVIVKTFKNAVDAGVLKSRLEAAGIEACIPEEYSPQIFFNVIPCPLQSVTVRVTAKDYAAAKEILDNIAETSLTAPKPGETETVEAPPSKEQDATPLSMPGKLCVSCGTGIPIEAELCPKCGWTQPDRA